MTNMTNKKYTATDGHKYSYHYIEKTDKQEEVQEVRVRKPRTNQPLEESISSSPPLHSNNNSTNYFGFIDKSQLSRIFTIGGVLIFLLSAYFLFPQKSPSHFFRDFANTTKGVFEEINSVDLPAANSLTQHTVSCRNAANMVQSSPAFKDYGSQIASGLRDFGEKITEAGRNLQKLYNKGSSVYKSFDHEIEAMMNRLKMNQKKGETKYFKNKINKLINKIKDFRELVEKTQSSIHNAEEIRHDTEGYIMNGLREARKYVSSNSNEAPQHSVDLSEAQKELLFVSELLDHLKDTAIHLDRIRKTLLTYEDKLLDVEAELSNSGDDDDDVFEVTKEDLKYLKQAVDVLKSTHYKFSKLSD